MRRSGGLDRVVVINDDALERGGAATIALASVRALRSRDVPVALLSGGEAIDLALARRGVGVASLGGTHLLDGSRGAAALRGLYDWTTCRALAGWIERHDTPGTVYHLHNWHKVLSPSIFQALRPVAARLVISAHDYFLACPNGSYFLYPQQRECALAPNSAACVATACDRRHYGHKLWRVARHAVRHRLLDLSRSPALVLAVHEATVPLLARGPLARCNIRVLRNPVTPWRAARVRAEQNRDVFFVGRLEEDKGPDLLVRAARRAGVRVRLIGAGPLAEPIARDFPEVELLGWRSREEIAALVAEARLVVSPTRCRETFGLVALEALMSGIPVVVSPLFATAAEIVDNGFGLACDPGDEAGLAAALSALARDDRRVEAISRHAFTAARRLAPSPAQWCDALLALYAERIGTARSAPPLTGEPALASSEAGG